MSRVREVKNSRFGTLVITITSFEKAGTSTAAEQPLFLQPLLRVSQPYACYGS